MTANDILLKAYPMHNVTKANGSVILERRTDTPVEEFWRCVVTPALYSLD